MYFIRPNFLGPRGQTFFVLFCFYFPKERPPCGKKRDTPVKVIRGALAALRTRDPADTSRHVLLLRKNMATNYTMKFFTMKCNFSRVF